MSKIFADRIQKPGGTALTLPAAAGLNESYLQSDGTGNLQWTQPLDNPDVLKLVAPENKGIIGAVFSHDDRQNIYSTPEWTSTGPWTTFGMYAAHSDNSLIQFMNLALGDGMGPSGSSEGFISGAENQKSRQLIFSNGNRLGYMRDTFQYDNATGTAGNSYTILPIRNTNTSSASVTVSAYTSDYWSNGYEGSILFYLTPTTGLYSAVSAVSSTRVAFSQTQTRQTSLTGSVTIPAGTTVLVCLGSTDQYQTTYRFKDTCYFYNLTSTFSTGIICDMRILTYLARHRSSIPYSGAANGNSTLAPIWTETAAIFGDR